MPCFHENNKANYCVYPLLLTFLICLLLIMVILLLLTLLQGHYIAVLISSGFENSKSKKSALHLHLIEMFEQTF